MVDDTFHDRYTMQGEIARGGMGVILRVKDRNLDRTLAMKRMLTPPDETGGDAEVARFARFLEEAQLTAQLDHPSIVPIHELGTDAEGRTYYTMRLVKGREFGQVIREIHEGQPGTREGNATGQEGGDVPKAAPRVTWNLQRALGVMVRVCQAVAYAHGKGVIHRDLKPANIMVGDLGEVYVLDWGVAKLSGKRGEQGLAGGVTEGHPVEPLSTARWASGEPDLETLDGAVVGTAAYMPPEQAAGRAAEVDERSDIYALGAILYEVLVGHPPYLGPGRRASAGELLTAVTRHPPEEIRQLNAQASAELAAICEKAMARDPAERYPSCVELAEELQAYLDQRVVKAHRSGPWAEARKWVQRHRGTSFSALVAIAVGLGALATINVMQARSRARLAQAFREQKEAAEREALARADAVNTLVESYAQQGFNAARSGEASLAALWFAQAAHLATHSPQTRQTHLLRAANWKRAAVVPWRAVPVDIAEATRMQFDRDGRFLAVHDSAGGGHVLDLEGERALSFGGASTTQDAVALHPQQPLVAVASSAGVARIHRLSDERVLRELDLGRDAGRIRALAFSGDGRLLAVGARETRVWDLERDALWAGALDHPAPPTGLQFSANREFILSTTRGQEMATDELRVFSTDRVAASGEIVPPLFAPLTNDYLWTPAFADGGRRFYRVNENGRLMLHDSRTGGLIREATRGMVLQVAPGPLLITRDAEGLADAPSWMPVPDETGRAGRCAPDRQWVALGREELRIEPLDPPRTSLPVRGLFRMVEDCTFSPDGRLLATAETYGLIRVWKLPSPREVPSTYSVFPESRELAFHPREQVVVPAGTPSMNTSPDGVSRSPPVAAQAVPIHFANGLKTDPAMDTGGHLLHAAFSPDGEALATASARSLTRRTEDWLQPGGVAGNVQVWDWRAAHRRLDPTPMPSEPRGVGFHPNGQWLAAICLGGEVMRVEVASGLAGLLFKTDAWSTPPSGRERLSLCFMDGGDVLVVAGERFYAWDVRGARLLSQSASFAGGFIDWDVTGEIAGAVRDQEIHCIDLRRGTSVRPPLMHQPQARSIAFLADGGWCFTTSESGARLWDWRAGRANGPDMGTRIREGRVVPGTGWGLTLAESPNRMLEFWELERGWPVSPPLGLSAEMIRVSPDGSHALALLGGELQAVDLTREFAGSGPALDLADSVLQAEIDAGARIEGGGVVKMSQEEWLDRWHRFRQRHRP